MARLDILTANDRPGEFPNSYYAATATRLEPFPEAEGEISCDVVVIGGGYTGLSAALHLAEAGMNVAVLEAHRMGFGASGRIRASGWIRTIWRRWSAPRWRATCGTSRWKVSISP
jgi:gamma-glutamylputrescine oxidase